VLGGIRWKHLASNVAKRLGQTTRCNSMTTREIIREFYQLEAGVWWRCDDGTPQDKVAVLAWLAEAGFCLYAREAELLSNHNELLTSVRISTCGTVDGEKIIAGLRESIDARTATLRFIDQKPWFRVNDRPLRTGEPTDLLPAYDPLDDWAWKLSAVAGQWSRVGDDEQTRSLQLGLLLSSFNEKTSDLPWDVDPDFSTEGARGSCALGAQEAHERRTEKNFKEFEKFFPKGAIDNQAVEAAVIRLNACDPSTTTMASILRELCHGDKLAAADLYKQIRAFKNRGRVSIPDFSANGHQKKRRAP
jgi:hypothetical protein